MQKINEVIQNCINGNERSKTLLFEIKYNFIKRSVRRYFKDPDTIDEVIQLSFIKIFNKLKSFNTDNFNGWCNKLACNTALDYIQSRKTNKVNHITYTDVIYDYDLFHSLDNYNNNLDDVELTKIQNLHKCINKLTPKYKIAINMFYFEEKTFGEISKITGTTESTAKTNCLRARRNLKVMLNL
jgi:RNA polymerase sigma-70 factor (ECF subfamily)